MRRFLDTLGGVYELARLFVISRGRLAGAYWSWRKSTAIGAGEGLSRAQRMHGMLEYARWVRRMRRLM